MKVEVLYLHISDDFHGKFVGVLYHGWMDSIWWNRGRIGFKRVQDALGTHRWGVIFGLVPCTSSHNHGSQKSGQIIATSHDLTPNNFISIKSRSVKYHSVWPEKMGISPIVVLPFKYYSHYSHFSLNHDYQGNPNLYFWGVWPIYWGPKTFIFHRFGVQRYGWLWEKFRFPNKKGWCQKKFRL